VASWPHRFSQARSRRRITARSSRSQLRRLDGRRWIKPGITYGETDDFCYNITENSRPHPRPERDGDALLGINHEQLTYRFQGRDFRSPTIHGEVVKGILA